MADPKNTDPATWAQYDPNSRLNEAIAARDLNGIAWALERHAAYVDDWRDVAETTRLTLVADILHAAAAYRLVVAQEQTAYLLQRLVDAAERDK